MDKWTDILQYNKGLCQDCFCCGAETKHTQTRKCKTTQKTSFEFFVGSHPDALGPFQRLWFRRDVCVSQYLIVFHRFHNTDHAVLFPHNALCREWKYVWPRLNGPSVIIEKVIICLLWQLTEATTRAALRRHYKRANLWYWECLHP